MISGDEDKSLKKPVTFEELLKELEGQSAETSDPEEEERGIQQEPVTEPEPEKTYRVFESPIEKPAGSEVMSFLPEDKLFKDFSTFCCEIVAERCAAKAAILVPILNAI